MFRRRVPPAVTRCLKALGVAILGAAALAGCAAGQGNLAVTPYSTFVAPIIDAEILSVVNTKKTLDDHIVSLVTGNDCSTVRASRGEPYCLAAPERTATVRRTSYCYKSLANVNCYDQPLPRDGGRFLGSQTFDAPLASN